MDSILRKITVASLFIATILVSSGGLVAYADEKLPVYDGIGGDFSANSSLGRTISLSDYGGKAVLLFFGYTSCQDICPAALGHLRALTSKLGATSEQVQVLFVTVDPETDTPEHLATYLSRFDSRFVGVTGSPAEMASIARSFMVKHDTSHETKVTTEHHRHETFADESFQYAHSQQIYLLDGHGRTRALFFTGSPLDEMASAIHSLVDSKKGKSK
jgi:protein SCO1/2